MLSEEDGVTLLDMIVCHSCKALAKELGLRAEEIGPIMSRAKRLVAAAHSGSRITL